ncbi:hypothetical protein AC630_27845 [Bradyrhizobium sp. AS23.2]|nr:hypothetical protein AC630_27845 [Bradyrhizobium sp. AS23.2]
MLALVIALWLDMPRPYWALASVYITSNQLTGATWSKAVYRMLGTLIGAAGTIALVPNLVDAPELLSLAIALWVGVFLYFSLIDGTPRSYLFMLSGYTVALLGFPVISSRESLSTVADAVSIVTCWGSPGCTQQKKQTAGLTCTKARPERDPRAEEMRRCI